MMLGTTSRRRLDAEQRPAINVSSIADIFGLSPFDDL